MAMDGRHQESGASEIKTKIYGLKEVCASQRVNSSSAAVTRAWQPVLLSLGQWIAMGGRHKESRAVALNSGEPEPLARKPCASRRKVWTGAAGLRNSQTLM